MLASQGIGSDFVNMLTSHLLKNKLEWKRSSHICWLYAFLPSTVEVLRPILGPM
jgi:hypothetical protein